MNFDDIFWADKMIDDLIAQIKSENNISEEDWNKKIDGNENILVESFQETFENSFPKFIKENRIKEMNDSLSKFEVELDNDYKSAFENLETFSFLFNHFGIEYLKSKDTKSSNDLRNFILQRLFFRAIQIDGEIIHLLKGGFPNGALARWRSLHEIVIVFIFLKNGNDNLIQMYNDHQIVTKYKRVNYLLEHNKTLNWELPEEEIKKQKMEIENIVNKYGKEFLKDYGWAKDVLSKNKRTISGIEEFVQLNYLRSFYSYASDDIHAGMSSLGKDNEISFESYVSNWGGRTVFGYIDPVQLTTSSLYTLLYNLVSDVDTLGNYIYIKMMKNYHDTVVKEFIKCEENLKNSLNDPAT